MVDIFFLTTLIFLFHQFYQKRKIRADVISVKIMIPLPQKEICAGNDFIYFLT